MSAVEALGPFTLVAGTALLEYRLVKLSTATAVYCAAGDVAPAMIGRTNDQYASGAAAGITPLTRGKMRLTAGAAIAAGAAIYPAANGKVSSTAASGTQIGYALEAASADNSEFTAMISI